jgi:hypothetical protein
MQFPVNLRQALYKSGTIQDMVAVKDDYASLAANFGIVIQNGTHHSSDSKAKAWTGHERKTDQLRT